MLDVEVVPATAAVARPQMKEVQLDAHPIVAGGNTEGLAVERGILREHAWRHDVRHERRRHAVALALREKQRRREFFEQRLFNAIRDAVAIQVLGGAGYTRDWPLEQYLRDARAMTIYEGTTGMQAIDLLTRRLWAEEGRGLGVLLRRARSELSASGSKRSETALIVLSAFEEQSNRMMALKADPEAGLYQANAYLHAAWDAIVAWMAVRVDAAGRRLALPTGAAA